MTYYIMQKCGDTWVHHSSYPNHNMAVIVLETLRRVDPEREYKIDGGR